VVEIDVVGALADSLPSVRTSTAVAPASTARAASGSARQPPAGTGPNLEETLGWLTQVLNSTEHNQTEVIWVRKGKRWRDSCEIQSATFRDGRLVLQQDRATQTPDRDGGFTDLYGTVEQLTVALADLDPKRVRASASPHVEIDASGNEIEHPFHWTVSLTARNREKVVRKVATFRHIDGTDPAETTQQSAMMICVSSEQIANRMVNAFRRAIELSGGRASAGEVF
jgi:hypothetical protein